MHHAAGRDRSRPHQRLTIADTVYVNQDAIMREYVTDSSVDLVYLDPPFNFARNYNVLFRDEVGKYSEAQIEIFEDTWHWTHETERTYHELVAFGAAPWYSGAAPFL